MLIQYAHAGMYDALEKYAAHLPDGVKHAIISALIRKLETPIPGTPKILMEKRTPEQLAQRETGRRDWQREHIHDNIYKALKKMKVDKLYQAGERFSGSTAEPHIRAQYGDRQIWSLAHAPVQHLLSAPAQVAAGALSGHPVLAGVGLAARAGVLPAYTTGRAALEKLIGAPGPLSYGSPIGKTPSPPARTLPALGEPGKFPPIDPHALVGPKYLK
jgi:hypothetical protein